MALGLKEWHVVAEAIARGDQVVTIRKGGIHEKSFAVAGSSFWLFPGWEHQVAGEVKRAWHGELSRSDAERPADPRRVPVRCRCEVVRTWEIAAEDADAAAQRLAALDRFHLWTPEAVADRLRFRPTRPLVVLLLRAAALVEPIWIERTAEHDGCRSWIELPELPVEALLPSLAEVAFGRFAGAVEAALEPSAVAR